MNRKILPLISLVVPITVVVSCYKSGPKITQGRINSVKNFVSFSKKHNNILFLFSDECTGSNIKWIIQNKNKALKNELTNFTFYDKTITAGGVTNTNVPVMMGGWGFTVRRKNDPQSDLFKKKNFEFMNQAYAQTVNMLREKNYEGDMVGEQWFGPKDSSGWWGNADYWNKTYNGKNKKRFQSSYPYDLLSINKQFSYGDATPTTALALDYLPKAFKVKESSEDNSDMYKGYFNESTHLNWQYMENGEVLNGSVEKSQEFFLERLRRIIKKLKDLDVYNNTMIIVASDHGNHSGKEIAQHVIESGNEINKKYGENSMFMFKPFTTKSASEKLIFNDTNVISTADIPQIIAHGIKSKYFEKLINNGSPSWAKKFFNNDPLNANPNKRVFSHESANWFSVEQETQFNNNDENRVYSMNAEDIYFPKKWLVNTYGNPKMKFKDAKYETYNSAKKLKSLWYKYYTQMQVHNFKEVDKLIKKAKDKKGTQKIINWKNQFINSPKVIPEFIKWINDQSSFAYAKRSEIFNLPYKK